jgi:hypothetical protein
MTWNPITRLYKYEGWGQGHNTPTHHHMTTLAATPSWPNSETLTVHKVLAHPCAAFHPCTSRLRGGAVVVAAALISYGGARSLQG